MIMQSPSELVCANNVGVFQYCQLESSKMTMGAGLPDIPAMVLSAKELEELFEKGREQKGWSRLELANQSGVPYHWINDLYRNKPQKPDVQRVQKVLTALGLVAAEEPRVPVVGYVGAGAKYCPYDDYAAGTGFEMVECPSGFSPHNIVALRVLGDSMEPMMEEGWLIFYRRETDGVPPDCIGEHCVVKLEDDTVLVKKVRQGSKPGFFHLLSKNPNHEPIFDAKLQWASRVIDIRPR
jgi:phage repressor protein C with HTH and peptisase S24 domain